MLVIGLLLALGSTVTAFIWRGWDIYTLNGFIVGVLLTMASTVGLYRPQRSETPKQEGGDVDAGLVGVAGEGCCGGIVFLILGVVSFIARPTFDMLVIILLGTVLIVGSVLLISKRMLWGILVLGVGTLIVLSLYAIIL